MLYWFVSLCKKVTICVPKLSTASQYPQYTQTRHMQCMGRPTTRFFLVTIFPRFSFSSTNTIIIHHQYTQTRHMQCMGRPTARFFFPGTISLSIRYFHSGDFQLAPPCWTNNGGPSAHFLRFSLSPTWF